MSWLRAGHGRGPRGGHFDDDSIEFRLQRNGDDRLIRQFLRWLIPWSPLGHATLEGVRNQSSDFFALQRHELLVGVIPVELRTEIYGMDSRIISFHDEEVLRSQKDVVPLYGSSLQRGSGNTQSFRRRTDDGSGLQQDNPVLLRGVIRMDRDKVTRHFSLEDTHSEPRIGVVRLSDESSKPGSEVNRVR